MNRLDRAIAYIAPVLAAQRARARAYIRAIEAARAYYDGADVGRRGASIRRSGANADTVAARTLPKLRAGSHDLVRNNPHANRGVEAIVSNVIGAGIIPRFKRGKSTVNKLQKLARATLDTTEIDIAGQMNYYGLQELAMKTVVESGEALIIRRFSKSWNFPVRFGVYEPDHLDSSRDTLSSTTGRRVIQGVQFDANGRREGYWLYPEHPGGLYSTMQSVFVPARDVAHVYRIDRPGQVRGIPWLAPVMLRMADFSDYEEAQLVRQKIAACFAVFVNNPTDAGPAAQKEAEDEIWEQLEPGSIYRNTAGGNVEFGNPPQVLDYKDYAKVSIRAIAAGLGVTYEALSGDLEGVNFSSGKMGRLELERNVDRWRWVLFIPQACEVMTQWWLQGAQLTGANIENVEVRHTPPAREMISPEREVPAKVNALKSGQKTLHQIVEESGRDFDEHLDELQEERQMLEERGISLDFTQGIAPVVQPSGGTENE